MFDQLTRLNEFLYPVALLWKHKLFRVAGIDFHLGSLILALLILLFANRISRLAVKIINRRLILPFVEEKASQTTYQTFAFYGSLGGVVTLALTIMGIPLTVFTVFGGALAIGVGFGSQNIVNNFISGVILLVEQPIKVGDVVELDSISGTILSIGTRSTKIKNVDNKIFVVPNSFFLEKSVLNWTYESSTTVRTMVSFGVAYGSDVKQVENLCMHIMLNTEGIDQTPLPQVHFENFGDNNLNFEMIFWCNLNKVASLAQVRSDVRFKVDQQFRESKIEMAFPQRDMNLKISRALEVKLLS